MLDYKTIATGLLMENCYLVWDDDTRDGIFIDPGDDAGRLISEAASLNVSITGIFNTHAHFDHAGAVAPLVDHFKVPFAVHRLEEDNIDMLSGQPSFFGVDMQIRQPAVDRFLEDNDTVMVGQQCGAVLHTPGHSPGGVCFHFGKLVFVGDTLFAGSVGRSDLPGGNGRQLVDAIKTRLMTLPEATTVLPGHGPKTTIGKEKRHNPFIEW